MRKKLLLSTDIIKLREDTDLSCGCAVAVGNFDGVHLGHRALLSALKAEAECLNMPAAVFTFDSYDSPKNDSKLLAQPERKLSLLYGAGVDSVFSAPFSKIKEMSASDFAEKLLFESIGAKSIICGYDFRFGKGREGDVGLIKRLLSQKGVTVITPEAVTEQGVPVSSTHIRSLVSTGEMKKANRLLGHNFVFEAVVSSGARLGRTIGFPTVNQVWPEKLVLPRFGVYAVKCKLNGKIYGGVANVGMKPTVANTTVPLCETHIFDYSGDCYGETVETEFLEFIRPEKRFGSLTELQDQIRSDCSAAKAIISEGVYV